MANRSAEFGLLRGILLLILLVALGVALLYAYRAQSPSTETVSYGQLLTEIQSGQVRAVTVEGNRATITLSDGTKQQATLPDQDQTLARAVSDRNQTDPAHPIGLRYEQSSSLGFGVAPLAVLLGLLPVLVIIALILLTAAAFGRARAPHRYELLARLADLRDRGAISEEEFEREKRRVLG